MGSFTNAPDFLRLWIAFEIFKLTSLCQTGSIYVIFLFVWFFLFVCFDSAGLAVVVVISNEAWVLPVKLSSTNNVVNHS